MNQVGAPRQQENCRFLQKLPQELRDEVYDLVFSSTRFCFGERTVSRIGTRRVVSANRGRSLSLLRTCHQIHDEVGQKWLHQALFIFENPEALLDKLTPLSVSTLSQIKHMRISGDTMMVSWGYDDVYYRTAQVLKLLPGLNLDRLTVMGMKHASISYETLSKLIVSSSGWKSMRYLSHNSELLGFVGPQGLHPQELFSRQPQPMSWQNLLDERDGRTTAPSVTVYRSNSPTRGSVLTPGKRTIYCQLPVPRDRLVDYGTQKDQALMQPGEREKEILIIVKRGAGITYAEENPAPLLSGGDIREDSPAQTWAQIKAVSKEMSRFSDDDSEQSDDDLEHGTANVLVDEYSNVDDYTWPPFHFMKQ
ncbi:hypothetical protein Slin15195_G089460 [Septoria linicola]|uniref:F-box domain-containing protein n=1 Tax=Septoria linicola TaxID=215465 RepID=A0A9Q9ATP4_9PEZI|nr:hypothetical protein Slin15195_G089460 [Septoria linicola]